MLYIILLRHITPVKLEYPKVTFYSMSYHTHFIETGIQMRENQMKELC